jgi:arylsulfatase A-like enzyme
MRPFRSALLFLLSAALAAAAAPRPPNFLFIYTDDQRHDALGVVQREQGAQGRFPWLQTPHLDRLAVEGLRFRKAFVTLSLCAPSRAVFMTGRYNHLNGVANNQTPFPEDSVTHATAIKSAGYTTAYIGKWHMGGQRGKRPGFDYSASFTGQGRYFDTPFEINGELTPTKGWIDDVSTDYTIDFIKRHRDRPFSVVLGYKTTHSPFEPPERAKNRFADARARRVPNLDVHAIYRQPTAGAETGKGSALVPGNGEPRLNLGYFRCISAIDDNVGRLLQTLDELGLAADTVVIFSSDNGYYHGEHGLGDKRSAYEESLRIPLLVRYPRLITPGTTSDELVLNLDLAPTIVDLAGATVPRGMQGRSWRPLFDGRADPSWRQSFLAEYFWEANFPTTPTLVAVRTHTAKLIKYPGHDEWTELFDLARDPYETRNLARSPQHRDLLARMQAEFDRQVQATQFHIPAYAHKPGDALPAKKKKKGQ